MKTCMCYSYGAQVQIQTSILYLISTIAKCYWKIGFVRQTLITFACNFIEVIKKGTIL